MPYIDKKFRNDLTFNGPRTRGDLNWAITTRLVRLFLDTPKGYSDHVEIKALIAEILKAAETDTPLYRVNFEEFRSETRDVMEEIDTLFLTYVAETGDCAGGKQVLRDVIHEWNRRMADPYEDLKIKQNGDCYRV